MHDIRFVEDNWESPTLGAWGLGWEVWLNGMEITQFTYFQQVGGLECRPVTGEITYGTGKAGYVPAGRAKAFSISSGRMARSAALPIGDVYHQNEVEQSKLQLRSLLTSKRCFNTFDQCRAGKRSA